MSLFNTSTSVFALIAAAGVGSRLGSDVPKQYHPLDGDTVIARSIQRLLDVELVNRVVVSIAAQDTWWSQQAIAGDSRVTAVVGGANRSASVLAGLQHILSVGAEDDWVLVHDAARPLVRTEDIERLIAVVSAAGACGGLLAVPVTDTIKQAFSRGESLSKVTEVDAATIKTTPHRDLLWQAQTPQFFPVKALHDALVAALDAQVSLTDEASAMEAQGHAPILVEGQADNIKITRAVDISVATLLLSLQS